MRFQWRPVISVALFVILGFQLLQSMRIDAYELIGKRLDIVGYWFCLLCSVTLLLDYFAKRRLNIAAIVLAVVYLIYVTVVIIFTDEDRSIIAFLISRYGLLMWFTIGVGCGVAFRIFEEARMAGIDKHYKISIIFFLIVLGIYTVNFSVTYISSPILLSTESYQSVATSASILLFTVSAAMAALWGANKPILLVTGYLVVGTSLVFSVVLMQSTSIVAVWGGLVTVFLGGELVNARVKAKFGVILSLLAVGLYIVSGESIDRITSNTRFNVFFGVEGEFSSLASRQAILETFWSQFAVSPIFGHFRAEIQSGVGHGEFIHSLPLSMLTHTGLIGTAMIGLALYVVMRGKIFIKGKGDVGVDLVRLMVLVILIGSVSTFLTWALFWFVFGALCINHLRFR